MIFIFRFLELFSKEGVFPHASPQEIRLRILNGDFPFGEILHGKELIKMCLRESPSTRPPFRQIMELLETSKTFLQRASSSMNLANLIPEDVIDAFKKDYVIQFNDILIDRFPWLGIRWKRNYRLLLEFLNPRWNVGNAYLVTTLPFLFYN